jgi:hypothetical protein
MCVTKLGVFIIDPTRRIRYDLKINESDMNLIFLSESGQVRINPTRRVNPIRSESDPIRYDFQK